MMIPGRKNVEVNNCMNNIPNLLQRGCSNGSTDSTFATNTRPITSPSPPPSRCANAQTLTAKVHKRNKVLESPILAKSQVGKKKWLPPSFVPGPMDVICARGKAAKDHSGNRLFRLLIQKSVERYKQSETKLDKSIIVSQIIESVREACSEGGFVKRDVKSGQWYEVGDVWAREKVGQSIRDVLYLQYKSSTRAKKERRQAEIGQDMETLVQTSIEISKHTKRLSQTLETLNQQQQQQNINNDDDMEEDSNADVATDSNHDTTMIDANGVPEADCMTSSSSLSRSSSQNAVSDDELLKLFTEANISILRAIKSDTTLQAQLAASSTNHGNAFLPATLQRGTSAAFAASVSLSTHNTN